MKVTTALCALLMSAFATFSATATPITYTFGVTATEGPLSGTTAFGTFTYDSSILPVGGGFVIDTGLLTDLDFTWDGIHYDATTVNTGALGFEADGTFIYALFGTNCYPGGCGINADPLPLRQWSFDIYYGSGAFYYTTPSDPINIFAGTTMVSGPVPEPSTVALAAMALGLLGMAVRGRQRPLHA